MTKGNPHALVGFDRDVDQWRAHCLGCSWTSDWLDTRAEARAAHVDHFLHEQLSRPSKSPGGSNRPKGQKGSTR
jgi:hypothetical protein